MEFVYQAKNNEKVIVDINYECFWEWEHIYGDTFNFENFDIKMQMIQCDDYNKELFGHSPLANDTCGDEKVLFNLIKQKGYRLVSFGLDRDGENFKWKMHNEEDSLAIFSLHGESTFNVSPTLMDIYKKSKSFDDFTKKLDGLKSTSFWLSTTDPSNEFWFSPEWAYAGEDGNYLLIAPESVKQLEKLFGEINIELKSSYMDVCFRSFADDVEQLDGQTSTTTVNTRSTLAEWIRDCDVPKEFMPVDESLLECDGWDLEKKNEKHIKQMGMR